MLKNHFKVAIRSFLKNKQNTFINLLGLVLGLSCCTILFFIVQYELSYDAFHSKADRIYRVNMHLLTPDHEVFTNGSSYGLPQILKDEFPDLVMNADSQLQATVFRYLEFGQIDVMAEEKKEQSYKEEWIAFTQPAFCNVFDVKWLAGDPTTSLEAPNQVVLSRKMAEKYFGEAARSPDQLIGKTLRLVDQGGIQATGLNQVLQVSGIIADFPPNSVLRMKVMVSFKTLEQLERINLNTIQYAGMFVKNYIVLPEGYDYKKLEGQFPDLIARHLGEDWPDKRRIVLQALRDIHFNTQYNNPAVNKKTIFALGWVGVLLLVISCINYVNLSTALAANRSREVAMRKLLGSRKRTLMSGAIIETAIIVSLAFLLAVGLTEIALRQLDQFIDYSGHFAFLQKSSFLLFLAGTFVVTILLSGLYPAFLVARFQPISILRAHLNVKITGYLSLRRGLILLQFAIAQAIIIGAITIARQVEYSLHKDLGFTKEAVITMDLPNKDSIRLVRFKNQLLSSPNIKKVSYSTNAPMSDRHWRGDFSYAPPDKDIQEMASEFKYGDEDYLETYGLEMVAGQYFREASSRPEVIVNEALLDHIGIQSPEEALGKSLTVGFRNQENKIIGVVKNFHLKTLHHSIDPCLIFCQARTPKAIVGIKLDSQSPKQLQASLQTTSEAWQAVFPEYVLDYTFLDGQLEAFYESETKMAYLFKIFSLIAILISGLGLYGLVSLMAVQRIKELGIRKVLGASVKSIIVLFSKEFTFLILLAFIIASGAAYYLLNDWLDNFAYRIAIDMGVFILASLFTLLIAWLTIAYRSIRAARVNPAETLRM